MNTKGTAQMQSQGQSQWQGAKGTSKSTIKTQTSKTQGQPAKQAKRTMSDLSDASNESMNLSVIQNQLDIMQETMLKKEDIELLITNTVTQIISKLEKQIIDMVDMKIKEKCQDLQDKVDSLKYNYDTLQEELTEKYESSQRKIDALEEKLQKSEEMSREANKKANRNEQYSRKNNIKIHDIEEKQNENEGSLIVTVQNLLKEQNVILQKTDILAIHRIPTKPGKIRPVLIKTTNNNIKTSVMKKRKAMKDAGHRISDDVTALNTSLINRLTLHSEIQSAWFFNGSIYGQTHKGERLKFDLFDNIDSILENHRTRSVTEGSCEQGENLKGKS